MVNSGTRGLQLEATSVPSGIPSPSVLDLVGSVPSSISSMFERPSPSVSVVGFAHVGVPQIVTSMPSGRPSLSWSGSRMLMRQVVKDRLDHEIYLTDERWRHICEEHSEMRRYRRQVLETVRRGRRFQDSVRPTVYLYHQTYPDLPHGNTSIVAVVCFCLYPDGRENNFILTAYQIRQ